MRKRKRTTQRSNTCRIIVAGAIIGAVIIGGILLLQSPSPGRSTTLRDTDTAFSFSTLVGQPAPAFSAIDVDGRPYTVMPGDDRPKAIVFYMATADSCASANSVSWRNGSTSFGRWAISSPSATTHPNR